MEYNKNNRPIYLNLLQIRLPIGGVVSILHRLTGVALIAALPLGVYWLQLSLRDETGFRRAMDLAASWPLRLAMLFLFWLLLQHLISGLRHLLLDLDIGITKRASRRSAWASLVVSLLLLLLFVMWWS